MLVVCYLQKNSIKKPQGNDRKTQFTGNVQPTLRKIEYAHCNCPLNETSLGINISNFVLQLSADVSGRNAETKVRGRYKEKLEEESRRKEKAAIPDEIKAKYAAWSKGEAQIKADRQRLQEDLHEMSKPLARY